jgi:short-subunit dehydrogenase
MLIHHELSTMARRRTFLGIMTNADNRAARARLIDPARFGPWALITGASAGIGNEFARQIAAHGINVVLTARRSAALEVLGSAVAQQHGVQYRVVPADLTKGDAQSILAQATRDLDIGLVVSNAGDAVPGEFLAMPRAELHALVRVNVLAHLDIAHHFGQRLATRRRGGLILVGALGATRGVPFMANAAATKAYVHSLGEALHLELEKQGVTVTVLMPGPTNTEALAKLGIKDPPMKPLGVQRCVSETLTALAAQRARIVPGRLMRIMFGLIPASVTRSQTAKMFAATLKAKPST